MKSTFPNSSSPAAARVHGDDANSRVHEGPYHVGSIVRRTVVDNDQLVAHRRSGPARCGSARGSSAARLCVVITTLTLGLAAAFDMISRLRSLANPLRAASISTPGTSS